MQGLLADYLPDWLPDDPNKHEAMRNGLLNFGAALMGGRGNLGQILGSGLMAGSQGYAGSLAAQQAQALQDAQMQHFKMENQGLQAKIDEPMQLAKIAAGVYGQPDQGAPAAPAGAPVTRAPSLDASLPGAPGAGTVAPVASLPQIGQPRAAMSAYDQQIALAQAYQRAGKVAAAKDAFADAEKLRSKLKEQVVRTVDGKRVLVNNYEDGRSEQVQGFAPDLEKLNFQNTGGSVDGLDAFTGQRMSSVKATQSPDSIASNATSRRGQDMVHNDANVDVPITGDAITNAAARYNVDGTLPPMGMGKAAAAGRSAILNKAAEMKFGVDPEQQRRDQIGNKNDLASQGAALRAFTSGKQGNSVRSFNVLQSHLDTFGTMADALDNGKVQLFNQIGNAYAAKTGQAAPTNFEAIKHIVGDEIVKAVTGSAGALGDREAAAKTIASINSPAQLKGVIESYKELANGQLKGLRQQYETSTGRTDFDKYLSQQAQETRAPKDIKDLPKKAPAAPQAGAVQSGWRFKGGDPANKANWEKA